MGSEMGIDDGDWVGIEDGRLNDVGTGMVLEMSNSGPLEWGHGIDINSGSLIIGRVCRLFGMQLELW